MKLCKDCKFCDFKMDKAFAAFYEREVEDIAKCLHDDAKIVIPCINPITGRETIAVNDYCSAARSSAAKCGYDAVWFDPK